MNNKVIVPCALVVGALGLGWLLTPRVNSAAQSTPQYPAEFAGRNAPEAVVMYFLEALRSDDGDALGGLVAMKIALADLDERHASDGADAEHSRIVARTVREWRGSVSSFDLDTMVIDDVSINGNHAIAVCSGTTEQGEEKTISIHLLREQGNWCIRPRIAGR